MMAYKDIFVANGIYKDITDQDYIQYTAMQLMLIYASKYLIKKKILLKILSI